MISTVFKSGNSQAIRIPKILNLNSNKIDIEKIGNALVIRELPQSWEQVFHCLNDFDGFMQEGRSDLPLQKRAAFK